MKLLFVHDVKVIEYNGSCYFEGSYNDEVLGRYLKDFHTIMFLSRKVIIADKPQNLTKISIMNIEFKGLGNYTELLKNNKRNEIYKLVEDADAVIARLPSVIGNFAIDYAKKINKPYAIELVACAKDGYWHHSLAGKLAAPFMYLKTKATVRDSRHTLYVSERFLQKRYPTKGFSISCSDVTLKEIKASDLEKRLVKIKNMEKGNKIVFCTIAAVNVRYKGQQLVIEAVTRLISKGYNVEYHLIGGGDNSFLKSLSEKLGITDKVKFIGPLPHNEIFTYLEDVDIYIQPSMAESHGRVILEAMSKACPVAGASTGGIPELVHADCLFKCGSVDSLERMLIKLINSNLADTAIYSFNTAKKFRKEMLDEKRSVFYKSLAESEM